MVKLSGVMRRNFDDYLKLMVPSRLYYSHKIAKGIRGAEPELAILRDIVPTGCTAIDNIGGFCRQITRTVCAILITRGDCCEHLFLALTLWSCQSLTSYFCQAAHLTDELTGRRLAVCDRPHDVRRHGPAI